MLSAFTRKDALHFMCGQFDIIHSLVPNLCTSRIIILHLYDSINAFYFAKMGDVDIEASSDCNLERDLEAQPHATGFELQHIDPQEPLRQRPPSRPRGTQVQRGTDDIRRRWFEHRGRWQRLFPFHGIVAVKEIKVNIFNTT